MKTHTRTFLGPLFSSSSWGASVLCRPAGGEGQGGTAGQEQKVKLTGAAGRRRWPLKLSQCRSQGNQRREDSPPLEKRQKAAPDNEIWSGRPSGLPRPQWGLRESWGLVFNSWKSVSRVSDRSPGSWWCEHVTDAEGDAEEMADQLSGEQALQWGQVRWQKEFWSLKL